jgi:hypothetical protein
MPATTALPCSRRQQQQQQQQHSDKASIRLLIPTTCFGGFCVYGASDKSANPDNMRWWILLSEWGVS